MTRAFRDPYRNQIYLVVVTVTKDNPEQLHETLSSVYQQKVRPNRHIVIDSSTEKFQPLAKELCERFGAEYFWSRPEGVYKAMYLGASKCSPTDFVWFINASDRILSPVSAGKVRGELEAGSRGVHPHWLQTGVIVARKNIPFQRAFPSSATEFMASLSAGKYGFPHPGAIMLARLITSEDTFLKNPRVTLDVELAHTIGNKFGGPAVRQFPTILYDETGWSSKAYFAVFAERFVHRLRAFYFWGLYLQLLATWFGVNRALQRVFERSLRVSEGAVFQPTEILPSWHFCATRENSRWPSCCKTFLLGQG